MKRVILTGASGFVGRQAIKPLLDKGFEVHAVSRELPGENEVTEILFWHQIDLLDAAKVENLCRKIRATHLLHFAWYVEHGKFWNALENVDWVKASLNLIQRFAENGGKRIVASGTVAEYDWRTDGVYSEESTLMTQHTLYGTSKYALYLILRNYAELMNLDYAWGRIFFLFGPGESPNRLVSSVVRALLKGESANCSHGNQIRDFLAVEDAADAFTALLDSDFRGAVNVASGDPITLKELVFKIADSIGERDFIKLGAIPAQKDEPAEIVADIKRLRDEVDWQPKCTLDERLNETIKWWRSRG